MNIGDRVQIKKGAEIGIENLLVIWNDSPKILFKIEEINLGTAKLRSDVSQLKEMIVYCRLENITPETITPIESESETGETLDFLPSVYCRLENITHTESETEVGEPRVSKIFYMNWIEGFNSPTKKFNRCEDAEEEAKRLFKKQNTKVYILKSTKEVESTAIYTVKDIE